jgi:hypothetical protein
VGSGPGAPRIDRRGRAYDEQLGDHHRFGFPSDTALVVARSALLLTARDARPEVASFDARLFGYRSLRTPLPESGAGRWPLGWEIWGDLGGDRARGLATSATLGWGLLAPLFDRGDLTDHLLIGWALAYTASFPTAQAREPSGRNDAPQALAAPLALELRAGPGQAPRHRSALAARLWVEPTALLTGPRAGVAAACGARVEAQVALRPGPRPLTDSHDPALVMRAQIVGTPSLLAGRALATQALISAGVDWR